MFVMIFTIYTIELSFKQFISLKGNPPGVNCTDLNAAFGENRMKNLAIIEYVYLKSLDVSFWNLKPRLPSQGYLACFCQNRWELGYSRYDEYNFVRDTFVYPSYPICKSQLEFTLPFGYGA